MWDGDLSEYNHPLPRWWMLMFYVTLAFAVVYLILYPASAPERRVQLDLGTSTRRNARRRRPSISRCTTSS